MAFFFQIDRVAQFQAEASHRKVPPAVSIEIAHGDRRERVCEERVASDREVNRVSEAAVSPAELN